MLYVTMNWLAIHMCFKVEPFKIIFDWMVGSFERHINCSCYLMPNNRLIILVGREFANGPGGRGSIPGWVIPKTFKKYLLA